jgi:hypothetical protein
MQRIYRIILWTSYGLGVLSLILGIALRFSTALSAQLYAEPRGALLFAACLFLCAIASYAALRLDAS